MEPTADAAEEDFPTLRRPIGQAAQQMLNAVLNSWSSAKTAKAAHPSMLPEDQQKVVKWLLDHKQVTISKFAKVGIWKTATPALNALVLTGSR